MKEITENFEMHAIVELFGHTKMAGLITNQTMAGASFVRIDVPATGNQPAFTRLLNPSAIYAINPVTPEIANRMAQNLQTKPIEAWDMREIIQEAIERDKLQLESGDPEETDFPI